MAKQLTVASPKVKPLDTLRLTVQIILSSPALAMAFSRSTKICSSPAGTFMMQFPKAKPTEIPQRAHARNVFVTF
jgi:hypothetical protein